MGAVAGGMTNVVDMMFDNWPMAFQLTEGATHAVQSPSGYYGFRIMNQFDEDDRILDPTPSRRAIHYVGHHVDHELVENIEVRLRGSTQAGWRTASPGGSSSRWAAPAPSASCSRRSSSTDRPMIERDELTLFVNLGDHADNWEWLQGELGPAAPTVSLHRTWDDTKGFADEIRERADARACTCSCSTTRSTASTPRTT